MPISRFKRRLRFLPALTALSLLSACGDPFSFKLASMGVIATAEGVFSKPDVNLKEKNLAAADYLAVQLQNNMSRHSIIHIQPMEELDNPGISSPFGLAVPEGIGLRFAELGFKVWLHDVAHGANEGLYKAPEGNAQAPYIMNGRYQVHDNNVNVYLRVIEVKSSQVVGQFDYAMPLNRELRNLSKTPVQIYRVR